MKNSALHMGAKHKTPIQANYASPVKQKPTEAELIAQAEKQFGGGVTVKGKDTQRDILARKHRTAQSGTIKKDMEQSVRSESYKNADTFLASKGDKEAEQRLKNREKRTASTKKAYKNNPDMTQAEVDKMMSEG